MLRYILVIGFMLICLRSGFAASAEEVPAVGDPPAYGGKYHRDGESPPFHGPGMGRHGGWRGKGGAPCYSGGRPDQYGACKPVLTAEDAVKRVRENSREDVIIDRVEERHWFFKADILDRDGRLLDRVIIHKRSGRVRSIY